MTRDDPALDACAFGPPPPIRSRSPRHLFFAALYFSEGAPIGLIWWALPVWLRTGGMPPGDIARLVALVAWPWALKFLWAPLIDGMRGGRPGVRGAIVIAQAFMLLSLAPLLVVGLDSVPAWLTPLLIFHALAASTQDAAIDTFAVHTIPLRERGAANAWMQVGMLAGRALFGGAAVLVAARWGERAVIAALVVAIAIPAIALLYSPAMPEPASANDGPRGSAWRRLGRDLAHMLGDRTAFVGFALAATAGAGFESLGSLAGPLLLDQGASEESVGFFFLAPSVVCMGLGALSGGHLSDRIGRRRAVFAFEAFAALVVAGVGLQILVAPGDAKLLFGLLLALYFAIGLSTAALYAMLMDLTRPRVAATQFGLFMAGINVCYVWSTTVAGNLIDRFGYGPALLVMATCSLCALPLLRWLPAARSRIPDPETSAR